MDNLVQLRHLLSICDVFATPPLEIFKARRSSIFESKKIFYRVGATDDAWIRHGVMADLFAFGLSAFQASIALPIGEARAGRGDRLFGRKAAAFAFDFK
ncbi:hypothetical protein NP552_11460 [Pseudomonas sp. 8209]|uniref:hypothetical protein n=1 Tax=Pseudomonas sp. 8209 TaxID=2967214 RepID=UPI0023642651|nr:hypothetical protein [Pseudomonas sp. 8209]MDD1955657.1 hypothetical protein [Pseudomonas sp. 8209]